MVLGRQDFKFFDLLSVDPYRRQQLRYLDLQWDDTLTPKLLQLLQTSTLPSLRHLEGVLWRPQAGANTSPPTTSLPQLKSFSVWIWSPIGTLPSAWFDLSALEKVEISQSRAMPGDTTLVSLLSSVSPNLRDLILSGAVLEDIGNLILFLGRFNALESLDLGSDEDHRHSSARHSCTAPALLRTFPSLRRLTLHDIDLDSALSVPHTNIDTLVLDEDDYDEPGPRVDALCRIVKEHPLRFSALKFVRLTFTHTDPYMFTSELDREVVRAYGAQLHEVGLLLLDDHDVEWRSEWNDAEDAAPDNHGRSGLKEEPLLLS